MFFLDFEILVLIVVVVIAFCRRTLIVKYFARRRFELAAKRALKAFDYLDAGGGQVAVFNHLLKQGNAIRSKRRVGHFYLIPGLQIDNDHKDVILRMADKNEPFWVALSLLYRGCMKDNYFGLDLPIPDLWSDDYSSLYQHWSANFQGGLDFVNPPGVWVQS